MIIGESPTPGLPHRRSARRHGRAVPFLIRRHNDQVATEDLGAHDATSVDWVDPEGRTWEEVETAWREIRDAVGDGPARWARSAGMSLDHAADYGLWFGSALTAEQVQSILRWWQAKVPPIEVEGYLAAGLTSEDITALRPEHVQMLLRHAYEDGAGSRAWRRHWLRERRLDEAHRSPTARP